MLVKDENTHTSETNRQHEADIAAGSPIPSSNIGHQLLVKMGWSGGGLGGVGIAVPVVATGYRHRVGLGSEQLFPELPGENQAFLRRCDSCDKPVPTRLFEEHCGGRKHLARLEATLRGAEKVAKQNKKAARLVKVKVRGSTGTKAPLGGSEPAVSEILVQAAQRVCEACQRAVPAKAWEMHCGGKKHKTKAARMARVQHARS